MTHTPKNATELDETRLIERTQQGDSEAFGVLVLKYHARLYRQITRRVKDVETAKDLTQEVWLKAYRGIKGFRGDSGFYSWVYRIAENVITDFFRKQKHDTETLHLIDESLLIEVDVCPSVSLERAERREQLRLAIAELPPLRRRVFLLYYHYELPIKAIAKRLCRSEGTIKTHLRNARVQLRELLTAVLDS